MALDPVKNFAKVNVSTGYNAAATSIVLKAGAGASLPNPVTDGAFNLVWWNSTDYPDPSDDPNREIVRVTARSTDTLTVTRGQEGLAASTKNIQGKTYKMILAYTAKTATDIANVLQPNNAQAALYNYNFAITDQNSLAALGINPDGSVEMSKVSALKWLDLGSQGRFMLLNPDTSLDVFSISDQNGSSGFIVRSTGRITIYAAADSDIPEVTTARGTAANLNARISNDMASDGFPLRHYFGEYNLRWTRERLGKIAQLDAGTQFDIAFIGDSYTNNAARYIGGVWQRLAAEYGDAGVGWVGFAQNGAIQNGSQRSDTTYVRTGTWTDTYYGTHSPDLGNCSSVTAADKIVVNFPAGQNTAKLFYVGDDTTAVASYQWDSGSITNLNLNGGAGLQTIAIPSITTGNTKLTITVVSGTVNLCGVNITNSTMSGIRVHKLGATGSNSNQWHSVNADWKTGLAALNPQLVVILLATNDQGASYTTAQFLSFMQTIITNIQSAMGSSLAVDILIAMPAENQRGLVNFPISAYSAIMRSIILPQQLAYIDFQSLFGVLPSDYAFGSARPWYAADTIHPDPTTGGRVMADALYRLINYS